MNTSDVLDRAADLIEEHGWGKGYESWSLAAGEGLCIEGAILTALNAVDNQLANSFLANDCPAGRAVKEYLGYPGSLCVWNDVNASTAEQVIAVLRATALIERSKENTEVNTRKKEEAARV